MARIAIAWELGGGYGHVARTLPVALALRRRGHEVVFLVRDLIRAATVLAPHGFLLLQAPLSRPRSRFFPRSYPDMLLARGYDRAESLAALLAAWRALFALVGPDLLLLDFAPTAALAARGLDLPKAFIGTGYFTPPRLAPLPGLRSWEDDPAEELAAIEAAMLARINGVLAADRRPPLNIFADIFEAEESFFLTIPELAHYGARPAVRYWGITASSFGSAAPAWPAVPGPRLLLYLEPGYWDLDRLLGWLRRSGIAALATIRATGAEEARAGSSETLRIAPPALDFAAALAESDAVVCHGNHGTLLSALLQGKPVLCLPQNTERTLVALRAAETGAALMVGPEQGEPHDYEALIGPLLGDPALKAAAASLAARYRWLDPAAVAEAIAERCLALLR